MKRFGFILFLVLVALVLAGALAVLEQMRRPLGPPLALSGAPAAALDPANWDQLPGLAENFRELLITDLNADQLLDLACMLDEVGGQARLLELPLQAEDMDGQGRVVVDTEMVRSLLSELSGE